jgi:hypothetical protein
MTTIVLNLEDPKAIAELIRTQVYNDQQAEGLYAVADAIEAAADKPVIVLDVEELGLEADDADLLRKRYSQKAAVIVDAVADALDSLTPPRPSEPKHTATGATVRDGRGDLWVWCSAGNEGAHWLRIGTPMTWAQWTGLQDPIEILSEGVPERGEIPRNRC